MRYGIKSISMDDIARNLGISKKTLYQHVSDKRELVRLVFLEHIQGDEQRCCEIMLETDNAIQQLLDLAQHLVSTHSELNPATIYDIQKYYPSVWQVFVEHKNTFIFEQVKQNLESGVNDGLYRAEINIDIVARLYIALVEASVSSESFGTGGHRHVEIFKELYCYHLHAVMSDKGRAYYNEHKETLFN